MNDWDSELEVVVADGDAVDSAVGVGAGGQYDDEEAGDWGKLEVCVVGSGL